MCAYVGGTVQAASSLLYTRLTALPRPTATLPGSLSAPKGGAPKKLTPQLTHSHHLPRLTRGRLLPPPHPHPQRWAGPFQPGSRPPSGRGSWVGGSGSTARSAHSGCLFGVRLCSHYIPRLAAASLSGTPSLSGALATSPPVAQPVSVPVPHPQPSGIWARHGVGAGGIVASQHGLAGCLGPPPSSLVSS